MIAKRRLGQNFLVDPHYQRRIVAALGATAGETIIEIGPGHGALTQWLVGTGAEIIAVEADRELIPELESSFNGEPHFHLIHADALEVDFARLVPEGERARVIGNLPYNIATPLIQRLVAFRGCIAEMVVMLQREVVDRMTARPRSKEYGYLSILSQFHCELERLFDVPPGAFRPAPKVHSSVIRLGLPTEPRVPVVDETLFMELAQVLFSQRRKTMLNNLRSGCSRLGLSPFEDHAQRLSGCGIDFGRRAETLELAEIARVADFIADIKKDTLV